MVTQLSLGMANRRMWSRSAACVFLSAAHAASIAQVPTPRLGGSAGAVVDLDRRCAKGTVCHERSCLYTEARRRVL